MGAETAGAGAARWPTADDTEMDMSATIVAPDTSRRKGFKGKGWWVSKSNMTAWTDSDSWARAID
jgi:hypothetical protein